MLEPPDVPENRLSGRGRFFRLEISAAFAYALAPSAMRDTARTRVPALHHALMTGLEALTTANAERWGLLHVSLGGSSVPVLTISSGRLFKFSGVPFPMPIDAGVEGPFVLSLTPSSPRVESQAIELVLKRTPSVETVAEIEHAMMDLVLRAI
jgi:hypothetical protein